MHRLLAFPVLACQEVGIDPTLLPALHATNASFTESRGYQKVRIHPQLVASGEQRGAYRIGAHQPPSMETPPQVWFKYLADMKAIQGNVNNDISFVSCLLAKDYLRQRFEIPWFDAALKSQSANGLDIDERSIAGERIIGEIKTTTPHYAVKFGANQIVSLKKGFQKLKKHQAEHKFMFVTDDRAFSVIAHSFCSDLGGVKLVCLTSGDEHYCDSHPV
ncbi:MAG TPA: hypothetical protein VGR29_05650 [Thermomicrobiales bacterium]|nr:hypothetical protein [Thermomicrobiales bacterium]